MNTSEIVTHLFGIAARCGHLVHMAIDIGLNGAGDGLLPRQVEEAAKEILESAQAIMQEIIDDQLRVCQERRELEAVIARPEPLGTATNGGRGHD